MACCGEQRGVQGPCFRALVSDRSRLLGPLPVSRLVWLPFSLGTRHTHDLSGHRHGGTPARLPSGLLGPFCELIPQAGHQEPPHAAVLTIVPRHGFLGVAAVLCHLT